MNSAEDSQPGIPVKGAAISDNWTLRLPATAHVQLFRDTNWASTPLGPLSTWGSSLRFATSMVFADSRGGCLYWGPHHIAIYNEAFVPMAGSAHPLLMGQPFSVAFAEINDDIQPVFQKAEADGFTVDVNDIVLFTERNGYLEETFFIGQFIPMRGEIGDVAGIYNTVYESTFRVLHDRRRKVLDLITALPSSSTAEVFQHAVGALQSDSFDVSMMALYSADEITLPGTCQLTLKGSIGAPLNHPVAPALVNLQESKENLISLFRKARAKDAPLVVNTDDDAWKISGNSLMDGIEWAGFGEQPKEVMIAPLENAARLFGFIVLGTNPRRKFDEHCHQFFTDVVQQLLAKLNSAITIEEAKAREQLLLRDLEDSEKKIRYMALYAPVAMVYRSLAGSIVWANDRYYEMLGLSKETAASTMGFLDAYHEDSRGDAKRLWSSLADGKAAASGELKLKRLFTTPNGVEEHACVLGHGFPLVEDEKVKYVMEFFTDVSRLKWAESVQSLNATAAREAKRQQELFIDITSHELRNPLGAVMQCAEEIAGSFSRVESLGALQTVENNVEIAETILACANHQKRIIDDVLLLSRLESGMLSITPVQTDVTNVVENAERMFRGECKQDHISFTIERHRSLLDQNVVSVMCDPSRLLQIIINILANGVRYVRPEAKRELCLTYGAAETASEIHDFNPTIRWCPSLKTCEDLTLSHEWGKGKPLYLFFSIRDTGPGLTQKQVDRLFQRFSQSSKRTHIQYGGSGLGLYISRELAEKQGGEIGVASKFGQGATFSFYIKARRTEPKSIKPPLLVHRPGSLPNGTAVSRSPGGNKLNILLTEDNLVNQTFLKRGLEMNNCVVQVANHGLEALECLKRSGYWKGGDQNGIHFDVILMDWEMPIMDGLATSKRIRELELDGSITSHIPIIAITANARTEQIQKAIDAGMEDVLPKPFLVSEMLAKIRQWTEKRVDV